MVDVDTFSKLFAEVRLHKCLTAGAILADFDLALAFSRLLKEKLPLLDVGAFPKLLAEVLCISHRAQEKSSLSCWDLCA